MGIVTSREILPVCEPEHKILDLTRAVDHDEFCKHIKRISNGDSLTELPNDILEEITFYETLLAQFNVLTQLPDALPLHLPHLTHLDLSYNQLTHLPHTLGLFFHLRILLVTHNRLDHLPDSFTVLHKLEKADLSHNNLLDLPHDIGNLQELKKLNVTNNRLTYLPKSLSTCRSLKILLAKDNYCQNPPQEVCEAGSEATLKYLWKNCDDEDVRNDKTNGNPPNVFPRVRSNQVESPITKSVHVQYVQLETQTIYTPNPVKTPLLLPFNSSDLPSEELKDKIIGLIYGAMIGDALGAATDLLSPDECHFHYDRDSLSSSNMIMDEHRVHWRKGFWTSNGKHMLLILDSIIQWAGVVDELDYAEKLVAWKQRRGYCISSTINELTSRTDYTTNPHIAAENLILNNKLSNGFDEKLKNSSPDYVDDACLPSAIILGILQFYNLREVVSNSIRICKATHASPLCIAASVTVSCIIALILQGKYDLRCTSDCIPLTEYAKMMGEEQLNDPTDIKQFQLLFTHKSLESALLDNSTSPTHPYTSLRIAVSLLRCVSTDYASSLTQILMQGGHATMNGCLSGAFLGGVFGFANTPLRLIQQICSEAAQEMNNKINTLLDMMGIP